MADETPIRQRIWKRQDVNSGALGEQARDIAQQFSAIPPILLTEVTAMYTEPMYLQLPWAAAAIQLLRIRVPASPETLVNGTGLVHFQMDANSVNRAKIFTIDGMSPTINSGITYTFYYAVWGAGN